MRYSVQFVIPDAMRYGQPNRAGFLAYVGRAVRPEMDAIASEAAGGTQYPPAKAGFGVRDVSPDPLTIAITNSAGAFGYTQGYRGLQPPSSKGTKLYGWAFERGLPSFPVARRLAAWGKLDAGSFNRLWQSRREGLLATASIAAYEYATRWGAVL